jgi:hypothetical protein
MQQGPAVYAVAGTLRVQVAREREREMKSQAFRRFFLLCFVHFASTSKKKKKKKTMKRIVKLSACFAALAAAYAAALARPELKGRDRLVVALVRGRGGGVE